jgi:hypothetical protein
MSSKDVSKEMERNFREEVPDTHHTFVAALSHTCSHIYARWLCFGPRYAL